MHTSRLTSSMTAPHKISRVCLFLLWFASHFIFLHSKLVLHSFESFFFQEWVYIYVFLFGLVPLAGRILRDFKNTTGQRYSLHIQSTLPNIYCGLLQILLFCLPNQSNTPWNRFFQEHIDLFFRERNSAMQSQFMKQKQKTRSLLFFGKQKWESSMLSISFFSYIQTHPV